MPSLLYNGSSLNHSYSVRAKSLLGSVVGCMQGGARIGASPTGDAAHGRVENKAFSSRGVFPLLHLLPHCPPPLSQLLQPRVSCCSPNTAGAPPPPPASFLSRPVSSSWQKPAWAGKLALLSLLLKPSSAGRAECGAPPRCWRAHIPFPPNTDRCAQEGCFVRLCSWPLTLSRLGSINPGAGPWLTQSSAA